MSSSPTYRAWAGSTRPAMKHATPAATAIQKLRLRVSGSTSGRRRDSSSAASRSDSRRAIASSFRAMSFG